MKLKHWIQAARLRTLPLSVSGIIVGCSLSNMLCFGSNYTVNCDFSFFKFFQCSHQHCFTIFWLCILTTISFQVLSNFANDYGDGIKGTDANRKGEKRLVASGEISAKAMKQAMIITAIIALAFSILTLYAAFGTENLIYFSIFIVLGLASIAAAIKYTVGENAYGYSGFGDLFVFLFFGLLSTVGGYFLYTKQLDWTIFFPAITVGLLSVAVLNLNNMRDQIEDAKNNKNTLVVKLGAKKAKIYHFVLILTALLCVVIFTILKEYTLKNYMFLIAFIPLLMHLRFVVKTKEFSKFDGELKKVALSTFLFAILFSIFS